MAQGSSLKGASHSAGSPGPLISAGSPDWDLSPTFPAVAGLADWTRSERVLEIREKKEKRDVN